MPASMTTLSDMAMERKSAGEPGLANGVRPSSQQDTTPVSCSTASELASTSSGPSSLAQESLSSASSFQSLSSKSSSGICADSAPGSPDKSYVNVEIPDGFDDLIAACSKINLGPPDQTFSANKSANDEEEEEVELVLADASVASQDQTFASAADDTICEADQVEQLEEEPLQNFKTCPALDNKAQAASQPEITEPQPTDTTVQPYVSFEESVLRKHQEKSEEFKSALASFQQSVTGELNDQPQQQQQTDEVAPEQCEKAKSDGLPIAGLAFNRINELKRQEVKANPFGSPDVSFKEVSGFDSTVLISDTDTEDSISLTTPKSLNETVLKSPIFLANRTQDIVATPEAKSLNATQDIACPKEPLNKTQEVIAHPEAKALNETQSIACPEEPLNKTIEAVDNPEVKALNETHDIAIPESSALNETHNIACPESSALNKTQDIVRLEEPLNQIQGIVPDNVLNKTQDSVRENVLNKTEDILNQNSLDKTLERKQVNVSIENQGKLNETNVLNKTQCIAQDDILNKTRDIVEENKNLNKTTDIVQESVLNRTQDIIKEKNILNKTQDIVIENTLNNNNNYNNADKILTPNKNQSTVQEINANYVQDFKENTPHNNIVAPKETNFIKTQTHVQEVKQELVNAVALEKREETDKVENANPEPVSETKEQEIKVEPIEQVKTPLKGDLSVHNKTKTPAKTELVTEKPIGEELKPSILDEVDLVASTPFDKSHNKVRAPKSPNRRSALFSQDPQQINSEEPAVPLEANKPDLETTVAVNHSFEEAKDAHNNSLNLLPQTETEYTAFKPQQQSTNLPANDFDLQEAALSVAKDIDASLEQIEVDEETDNKIEETDNRIEETEGFVSATELFGDPAAFDFLNQAGSSQPSRRGERYDSLFMKFDPLSQRLSMLPQKNQSPPVHEEEPEPVKETKSASPIATADPTAALNTPRKNPALAAIDRLLFYSPTVVSDTAQSNQVAEAKQKKEAVDKEQPGSPSPVVDEKMAKELELVRSTVLQLEAELDKQRREHKEALDKQKAAQEEKISSMQAKFSQMQSQLAQEIKHKEQMTVVVEEYEKSISRLIAEREKDKTSFEAERIKLQEDLQVANQHLNNTEAAFSDVHSKYERMKGICQAYKQNESVLKESIAENQETIKTLENRYEQLKSHAMAQLEKANQELSSMKKHHDAEVMKLKAMVRKAELKTKSLEETVEQKDKENKELTKIIDEMIARVD